MEGIETFLQEGKEDGLHYCDDNDLNCKQQSTNILSVKDDQHTSSCTLLTAVPTVSCSSSETSNTYPNRYTYESSTDSRKQQQDRRSSSPVTEIEIEILEAASSSSTNESFMVNVSACQSLNLSSDHYDSKNDNASTSKSQSQSPSQSKYNNNNELFEDKSQSTPQSPLNEPQLPLKDTSYEQWSKRSICAGSSFPTIEYGDISSTSFSDQAETSALVVQETVSAAVDTLSNFANDYLTSIHDLATETVTGNGTNTTAATAADSLNQSTSPASLSNQRKDIESMSTMARMRYLREQSTTKNNNTPTTPKNSSNSSQNSSSPKSISQQSSPHDLQKEKLKRWRLRKIQATKDEADIIHNTTTTTDALNTTASSALQSISEVDFSVVTNPINDVIVFSQNALAEAFVGKSRRSRDSSNAVDDSQSMASSYYSEDDSAGSFSSLDNDDDSDYNSGDSSGGGFSSDDGDNSRYSKVANSSVRSNRSRRSKGSRRGGRGNTGIQQQQQRGNNRRQRNDGLDKKSNGRASNTSGAGGAIKLFLDQITTDGINLHWHTKPINRKHRPQSQQVRVHIHISDCMEGGCDQVEPNLAWSSPPPPRSILKNNNDNDDDDDDDGKFMSAKQRCSLFDIASITKGTASSNRILQAYPTITNPENCVTITRNDKSMLLFEASDATEAKKVVHGIRWIVARLSFNLIIGNRDVCAELLPVPRRKNKSRSSVANEQKERNRMLTSEIMNDVTSQLVEKSLERLQHHGAAAPTTLTTPQTFIPGGILRNTESIDWS